MIFVARCLAGEIEYQKRLCSSEIIYWAGGIITPIFTSWYWPWVITSLTELGPVYMLLHNIFTLNVQIKEINTNQENKESLYN